MIENCRNLSWHFLTWRFLNFFFVAPFRWPPFAVHWLVLLSFAEAFKQCYTMRFSEKILPKQFIHVILRVTTNTCNAILGKLIPEKYVCVTEMLFFGKLLLKTKIYVCHHFKSELPFCRAFVVMNFHSETVDFSWISVWFFSVDFLGPSVPLKEGQKIHREIHSKIHDKIPAKSLHACSEKRRRRIDSARRVRDRSFAGWSAI